MSNDTALSSFLKWRQKNVLYSVMNVGLESSEPNTRSAYIRTRRQMYCTMYFVHVHVPACSGFSIQEYQHGVVACAPCPGDIKPKCQDFSKSSKSSKPPPGVYYHWLQSCTRPCQSILHSSKDFAGCTVYPLSRQLPVLEYHKPWFP